MDIIVDSNVLLRMLLVSDPHHAAFVSTVDRLLREGNKLFVNAQILSEFWSVATRPKESNGLGMTPDWAHREIESATGWLEIAPESANLSAELLRMAKQYSVSGKQIHDARIAAFMSLTGIRAILTRNEADYRRFGVLVIDPLAQ